MGTRMKGIYRGFMCTLSQIFVVKEREIEIGCPTDVKHVVHIGWDGPSGNAPSWMNEFRTVPDFATSSAGKSASAFSRDFGRQSPAEMFPCAELPSDKKKQKRKKPKSAASSSKSNVSSSLRSSRAAKLKSKFVDSDD